MEDLIRVENLKIDFKTDDGVIQAVKDISFSIPKGKTVGLVGESGSGKSVTSLAIMRLIASPPGKITGGKIFYKDQDLLSLEENKMRAIRGNKISMIFQEPMTSLNPVFTIGDQISETLIVHKGLSKSAALAQAVELLRQVGIPHPETRVYAYPHEMSGGQRQRVMIAMAIACEPELLIADEPTTALDVTIQKQILELLASLQKKYGMSILFITHDLGVIGDIADDVVVMYKGKIVEQAKKAEIFKAAKHPYTKGLLACRPTLDKNPRRLPTVNDFMTDERFNQVRFERCDTSTLHQAINCSTKPRGCIKERTVKIEDEKLDHWQYCTLGFKAMSRDAYSKIESYITQHFANEDQDLQKIAARLKADEKFGINVSAAEGKLLQWLVGVLNPKLIVEIGTLYGYSTIWMARALAPESRIISLEYNPDHAHIARDHVHSAGLSSRIEIKHGDAKEILKTLDVTPDLVFIDADKPGYKTYLDWAMKAVRVGGVIIGDNTFLFGHLIGEDRGRRSSPAAVESMKAFNETLAHAKNFRSTILPTYDGMTVAHRLA